MPPGETRTRQRVVEAAVTGTALAAAVAANMATRTFGPWAGLPSCPIKVSTGLDCPGCGTTRMVAALARGDAPTAADHNLLAVVALALFVGYLTTRLLRPSTARCAVRLEKYAATVSLAVLAAWTTARNVAGPASFLGSGMTP